MKSQKQIAQLREYAKHLQNTSIIDLFSANQNRVSDFTFEAAGLFLDASKNRLDKQTLSSLLELANKCDIKQKIADLFSGVHVNVTEDRPALHVALRASSDNESWVPKNFIAEAGESKARLKILVDAIRSGEKCNDYGESFSDVVMIGVGGSNLGPKLVIEALREEETSAMNIHFLDHLDGEKFKDLVSSLSPHKTLFVVASKSFGTSETLRNYESARDWLKSTLSKETSLKNQFVAITANSAKANATGIEKENILRIPDWVGGRYSVWSAMGMPIALKYGYDVYVDFLSGAATVDSHFKTAPLERNLPVILGMVGIWNTNFLKSASLAIIPYEHRLSSLPMYLQQLEMESNGKSISLDGTTIDYHSAPVTWGASGTDAQHSFCQLLHQGTHQIPVDFILALKAAPGYEKHQDMLVANCLAQSRALMLGNERQNNIEDYKKLRGDRPSSLIYMDELNPKTLGALISLYEHKTFVQSAVWNINPFDQWGVELGKAFASSIIDDIDSETSCNQSDPSTTAILARYKALKTGRST
jgi:glucose-6-phosphate isomerase